MIIKFIIGYFIGVVLTYSTFIFLSLIIDIIKERNHNIIIELKDNEDADTSDCEDTVESEVKE